MSGEAADHQPEVAGVHRLNNDDGCSDEEDVEQEHPDRFDKASEQAEGAERHHSDEDERLVLATVKVVRNLGEERRHQEDADRPREGTPA